MGHVLREVRKQKNLVLSDLKIDNLSTSQLSNIENKGSTPAADKFIHILSRLNMKYDEFIYLLEDEYLEAKASFGDKFVEASQSQNKSALTDFIQSAHIYHKKYKDYYFYHLKLIAQADLELLTSNNNYNTAREYLIPIRKYLGQVETWSYYEFSLLTNSLFLYDIDDAIALGNLALKSIEGNYKFYRNKDIASSLLNNLAIYSLDFTQYLSFSLKCSIMSEELSFTSHNLSSNIYAQVIRQLAYFKLQNGKFDMEHLQTLIIMFQTLGWKQEYISLCKFVEKHGILVKKKLNNFSY